jgi:peptidoglycan-associated lipoprotein
MRKFAFLLGLVFLFSISAAAQDYNSKIDIFAGYSFVHTGPGAQLSTFNANGGVASVGLNLTNWLSGVVEVGGVHATNIGGADVDATAETVMAGPKISLFHGSRLSPFAQALFGFVHTNPGYSQQTINHNTFAAAPGVGLDWNATRHVGIRLAQVDYLFTRMPATAGQVNWNNFRYSAGVVFRF